MSSGVIIRGSGPRDGFPDYLVKRLKRDKVGVLQGVTERHFKIGDSNQRIRPEWLDQGLAPNPGWGIPCVDCDAEIRDGIAIVTYFFEGQESEYSFGDNAVLYELDTTMEDEPIETHPAIAILKNTYGWDSDLKTFPEFTAGNVANAGTRYETTISTPQRNPLFGVESWRTVGVIFRRSYSRRSIPPSVYRGWGTVITRPDGIEHLNFPTQSTRPWLRLAAKIERRGNVSQITEEALLGKPGGIKAAKIIYNAAQIDAR